MKATLPFVAAVGVASVFPIGFIVGSVWSFGPGYETFMADQRALASLIGPFVSLAFIYAIHRFLALGTEKRHENRLREALQKMLKAETLRVRDGARRAVSALEGLRSRGVATEASLFIIEESWENMEISALDQFQDAGRLLKASILIGAKETNRFIRRVPNRFNVAKRAIESGDADLLALDSVFGSDLTTTAIKRVERQAEHLLGLITDYIEKGTCSDDPYPEDIFPVFTDPGQDRG